MPSWTMDNWNYLERQAVTGLNGKKWTIALMQGGDDWHKHIGRDATWYAIADMYDAVNQNTRATGNWKKSPPKIAPYPRPGDKPKVLTPLQAFGGFGYY